MPALLDCLGTSSAPLMAAALKVVADVAGCPNQFRPLLRALLERFRSEDGVRMLHVSMQQHEVWEAESGMKWRTGASTRS